MAKPKIDMTLLASIVAAGETGTFSPVGDAAKLEEAGVVEVNLDVKDDDGGVAVRATPTGIARVEASKRMKARNAAARAGSEPETEAETETETAFEILSGVTPPPVRRGGGGRHPKYPFADLEIEQGFFIKATGENPKPSKGLASTVSSANRRYASPVESGETRVNRKGRTVPVTYQTREFVVRGVEDGSEYGHPGIPGALVVRIK